MISLFSSMEPEREIKAASAPTVDVLERELSTYAHRLADLISSANDTRNSSGPDVLMSLSQNLEKRADAFLDPARKLSAASENAGYADAKESVKSIYHNLLQNQFSAMRLFYIMR